MVGTSVARARAQDQVEGSAQGTAWDVVPPSLAVLKERRCAAAEYFSAAYDTPPLGFLTVWVPASASSLFFGLRIIVIPRCTLVQCHGKENESKIGAWSLA